MSNSSRRAYHKAQKAQARQLMNKISCPNCNSPQEFRQRYQQIEDDLFEVYIKCSLCRKQWRVKLITAKERKTEANKARALHRSKIT